MNKETPIWEIGIRSAQVRVNGECVTYIDFDYVTARNLRRLAKYLDEQKKRKEVKPL